MPIEALPMLAFLVLAAYGVMSVGTAVLLMDHRASIPLPENRNVVDHVFLLGLAWPLTVPFFLAYALVLRFADRDDDDDWTGSPAHHSSTDDH